MTVISWYFIFPWQKGALGINLGLAHLDSENVFASHCPTNCLSCLRKTGFKKSGPAKPQVVHSLFLLCSLPPLSLPVSFLPNIIQCEI